MCNVVLCVHCLCRRGKDISQPSCPSWQFGPTPFSTWDINFTVYSWVCHSPQPETQLQPVGGGGAEKMGCMCVGTEGQSLAAQAGLGSLKAPRWIQIAGKCASAALPLLTGKAGVRSRAGNQAGPMVKRNPLPPPSLLGERCGPGQVG